MGRKEGKGAIKVSPTNELILFVESWGQISAAEILENAVKVLKDNLKIVSK